MILDTNILIDFLKGKPEAIDFVKRLDTLRTSVVVVAELYSGVINKREIDEMKEFLDHVEQLEVTSKIATSAGFLRRKYIKSHGIGIPDAIIAATANNLKIPVASLDKKHFSVLTKNLVVPY